MSFLEVLLKVLLCSFSIGSWRDEHPERPSPVWMAWAGGVLVAGAVVVLILQLLLR